MVVHVVPSPGGEGLGLDAKRHKVEGCCENNRSDSSKSERLSIDSFFASFFSPSSSPMVSLSQSSLSVRALLSCACCLVRVVVRFRSHVMEDENAPKVVSFFFTNDFSKISHSHRTPFRLQGCSLYTCLRRF